MPTDSAFLVVAWNNANADRILISLQDVAQPGLGANLIYDDTMVVTPDSGIAYAADTVVGTASGKCQITDVPAADYVLQENTPPLSLTILPCTMTSFKSTFKWYFTPTGTSTSTPEFLVSHTFVALRLVFPPAA